MYMKLYEDDSRSAKWLFFYCWKVIATAIVTLAPLIPLMFVLGCIDAYIVRAIDSFQWRVTIEVVVGLIDGMLWLMALCMLHTRFNGHKMPVNKAFMQALQRYPIIFLLTLFYIIFAGIFVEIMLWTRYGLSFLNHIHYMHYVSIAILLLISVLYVVVNVIFFMSFISLLLEQQTLFSALKRSMVLVRYGWQKAFLCYVGLFFIAMLVLSPDHFQFMRELTLLGSVGVQIAFAVVLLPFWFTWYLMCFNDLKVCHEYDQEDDEEA